jgi:branched-chain amino acid transport system permease protein
MLMASSWNVISGTTGQNSYAHAAFASLGAYTSALVSQYWGWPLWITIPISGMVGTVLGGLLGALCLRLSGSYLALVTLAFSEMTRLVLINEDQWTRGALGLQTVPLFESHSKVSASLLFAGYLILVLITIAWVRRSHIGLFFRAVKADEVAAASLGVHTKKYRILAFAGASSVAATAGALYGHYLGLITPDMGSLSQMFLILAMTVLGGLGTFWGPLLGAITLEVLSEKFRIFGDHHILVFGLVTLIVYRVRPQGLLGRKGAT